LGAGMRIYDQNLNGAGAAQTGAANEVQRTDREGGARAHGATSDRDRVELSSSLASLSRTLEAHHADRAARVQELAAQYQRGEYRPDSAATSRAMVGEALGAAAG
jgi:anti-sigma28 factor (negative regulator of flagellin synthesis)